MTGNLQAKTWDALTRDEFFEIARLRSEVFFLEQRITEPDFDDADREPGTVHYFQMHDGRCVAYGRAVELPRAEHGATRSFGRVAVARSERGTGLARVIVEAIVADWGSEDLVIHSQNYVVPLYEKYGFEVVSEVFVEAGIDHRTMLRRGTMRDTHSLSQPRMGEMR